MYTCRPLQRDNISLKPECVLVSVYLLTFPPPGKTGLSEADALPSSAANTAVCFPTGPEGHDEESR